MTIAVFVFLATAWHSEIHPPFKKAWNLEPAAWSGNMVAVGSRLYYGNWDEYGVLDAKTGHRIWAKKLPDNVGHASVYPRPTGVVVAFAQDTTRKKSGASLAMVNANDGSSIFSIPRSGYFCDFVFSGSRAYSSNAEYNLVCYDLASRKQIWEVEVCPKPTGEGKQRDGITAIALAGKTLAVSFWGGTVEGRSMANGSLLWRMKEGKVRWWMETANDQIILVGASNRPLTALRPVDGKPLWSNSEVSDPNSAVIIGNRVLVPTSKKKLYSLDARTGRKISSTETKDPCTYPFDRAPIVNGILYTRSYNDILAITVNAKVKWSHKIEDDGTPIYVDANQIVLTNMDTRLGDVTGSGGPYLTCSYVMGNPSDLPSSSEARRALAEKLVKDYAKLNVDQRRDLEKLGRDAFEPLLSEVLRLSEAYAKALKDQKGNTYPIYNSLSDLTAVLSEVMTKEDTDRLLGMIKGRKSGDQVRGTILGLLAQRGDREKLVPLLIEALSGKVPDFILYESEVGYALNIIGGSSHPKVIDFLIEKLEDPKADFTVRNLAYSNLGRTGGEKGKDAILAEKKRNATAKLEPLIDRMKLEQASTTENRPSHILQVRKTADGQEWALFTNRELGGWNDLWIAKRNDGKLANPIFTGINTDEVSGFVKPKPAPKTYKGFTPKQLLDGKWFEAFVGDATLTLDSDGDGLTDVAETRLATDPQKADTDGDGINDQLDPWPTVGRRATSDDEKAIEAAFEARYHFGQWDAVAVLRFPKDVPPFEMLGRKSPTLISIDKSWAHPIEQLYERGGILLGLGLNDETKKGFDKLIRWNANHTRATVDISSYSGGLSGDGYVVTVEKHKGEWIVVSMGMAYVS